jgi:hypothetical protein
MGSKPLPKWTTPIRDCGNLGEFKTRQNPALRVNLGYLLCKMLHFGSLV